MLSQSAIQEILGIREKVHTTPEDMATNMLFAYYPDVHTNSGAILKAGEILKKKLIQHGATEIPYTSIFVKQQFQKRVSKFVKLILSNVIYCFTYPFSQSHKTFFIDFKTIKNLTAKYKYRTNVCVIVQGTLNVHDLPMQYIKSFKDNSIISILDFPEDVDARSTFEHHFDISMNLFAYNMSNIILAVDSTRWMIYNFNASHPIFEYENEEKLDYFILNGLIPKVVAPISPHRLGEFKILNERFNINDINHQEAIVDLQEGSKLYGQTNLFPKGKKIDELNFRNNFHRLIGKLHLDSRSGMSFGFTAKQVKIAVQTAQFLTIDEKKLLYPTGSDLRYSEDKTQMFILLEINDSLVEVLVPEVWVLTLRSGADKVNFDLKKDILKMGIKNGEMYIQLPENLKIDSTYKPSFDTKVILAHAVGNVILASILKLLNQSKKFVDIVENQGYSISHWHGYFNHDKIPPMIYEYGKKNPHVACSSPQSAIYALDGKLNNFKNIIESGKTFLGDIHVEPHHGSNISYPNLTDLARYIVDNPDSVSLGNKYL